MLRVTKICNRIIEYSFYLLFFLVPLILTPWNYELFEFNKMMLTYLLTTVIVAAWLVKMIVKKRFLFQRTILDFPLVLFLGSQIIATLSSIDLHTSLWGYYSRANGGLFSTISYLLLYWAYVSNMNKRKTKSVIRYTLSAAALVAAYGVAERFGIDAQYWKQKVQLRVFSTFGQPNWLAAWLAALIPLTWAFALDSNSKTRPKKKAWQQKSFLIPFFLFILFYLCLLYTRSRSGFIGFGAACLVFVALTKTFKKPLNHFSIQSFRIFIAAVLLLAFLVGSPWTPSAGQIIKKLRPQPVQEAETTVSTPDQPILLISESGDIRKVVWQGAVEIWKNYPLFGTGVETFAYSYYWYRPRAHNDMSEWDFLYNKAHNEYLTILANSGLIGLLTYLGIIGTFIIWTLKRKVKSNLTLAFLSGYFSILVTNFLGFSVVSVNLLFFLMPAIVIRLAKGERRK